MHRSSIGEFVCVCLYECICMQCKEAACVYVCVYMIVCFCVCMRVCVAEILLKLHALTSRCSRHIFDIEHAG